MTKFRALHVDNKSGKVTVALRERQFGDLPAGDVLVKIDYSSVNYKDALAATGKGKIITRFPLTAGIDMAGRVIESKAPHLSEGDAVLVTGYDFGVSHDGGYAEYARVPARWVIPIPAPMTSYDAMALGTAGFTVALCVHRLEENHQTPERGPFVVSGATGGVGSIAVNVLSGRGYEVVALTGKMDEAGWLTRLGAARVIDRREIPSVHSPLHKGEWGGGIDNVGGDILGWLLAGTNPLGNIVSVGLAGGSHFNATVLPFILRGVSLLGVSSAGCPADLRSILWQRLASDLMPENLNEIASSVIGLEQLPAAFDAMLAGAIKGRTIVKINSDLE